MKQKAYTEIELVTNIENTVTNILGGELLNNAVSSKLDKRVYISSFKGFVIHTIVFKNGIVKYNLLTNKETYYTLTYKQLLSQLKTYLQKCKKVLY